MTSPQWSQTFPQGIFAVYTHPVPFPCAELQQVHGCLLAQIPSVNSPTADGHIGEWKNFTLPLAIKTADCLPILILGNAGFAFIHAGHKGLAHKILLQPAIKKLQPTSAALGPGIRNCCFEVQNDFYNHFPPSDNYQIRNGKIFFDLFLEARTQLLSEYPTVQIFDPKICTACNTLFHSYRRNKTCQRNFNIWQPLSRN